MNQMEWVKVSWIPMGIWHRNMQSNQRRPIFFHHIFNQFFHAIPAKSTKLFITFGYDRYEGSIICQLNSCYQFINMATSQSLTSKCVFYLLLVFTCHSNADQWTYDNQTIDWSGYTWRIKDGYRSPGPNYFTNDSISVTNDTLTLTSKPLSEGKWSSAEIYTVSSLGHGTYQWIIESEIATLPPQICLGLFTWEDNAPEVFNREVDIEISKFGEANLTTNAQFTIQPHEVPGNIFRFDIKPSPGRSQAEFTWSPCGVTFRLTKESDEKQYFNHTDTRYHMAHGNENVHINLWLFDGQPPTPSEPVTIDISSFTFRTLDETNPEYIVPCITQNSMLPNVTAISV
uniref:GH16 domain-containing protein n=1 Tax=Tetranychus urticae TaxID=32264 RepID=T1KQ08_TETUR